MKMFSDMPARPIEGSALVACQLYAVLPAFLTRFELRFVQKGLTVKAFLSVNCCRDEIEKGTAERGSNKVSVLGVSFSARGLLLKSVCMALACTAGPKNVTVLQTIVNQLYEYLPECGESDQSSRSVNILIEVFLRFSGVLL